ncbi:MAG TPA: DnaJ C-terminal domain-containing protein [Verrucomicrobiae bacterium]|nr:DnaJ C-terminal domain-containing protein [Verrucomicrobiae bacterium]
MPVKFRDYYQTLGVARDATEDQIKSAYRKLARKFHPDLNPGNKKAEERFKEISEANDVLSDKEKRKRYDALGANWKSGMDFNAPPGGGGPGGAHRVRVEDLNDLFGGGGGGFSDFFEAIFGRQGPAGRARGGGFEAAAARGGDAESEVSVSLEEAHRGASRSVRLPIEEPCSECHGTGRKNGRPCSVCGGAGVRNRIETFTVNIPKGVQDGSVVRVPGKGGTGHGGGGRGDLYLRVRIAPHPQFRPRAGGDIDVELPVAPWEAVLGGEVQVPTLDGEVTMRIPAESQAGRTLRLKGKGMARPDGSRGDEYVRLRIVVPPRPTEKEIALMKELADASSFDARRTET